MSRRIMNCIAGLSASCRCRRAAAPQADQAASAEKQKTAAQQKKDPTQKQKTETSLAT